ncbi:MAG: hypothetical protein AB7K52_15965 [Phycisphaerales bacterium]
MHVFISHLAQHVPWEVIEAHVRREARTVEDADACLIWLRAKLSGGSTIFRHAGDYLAGLIETTSLPSDWSPPEGREARLFRALGAALMSEIAAGMRGCPGLGTYLVALLRYRGDMTTALLRDCSAYISSLRVPYPSAASTTLVDVCVAVLQVDIQARGAECNTHEPLGSRAIPAHRLKQFFLDADGIGEWNEMIKVLPPESGDWLL